MKKFFRIELRIGEEIKYEDEYEEDRESDVVLSLFYSGTGVISLEEHSFEGYIANDYIVGEVGKESVAMIVFNYDSEEEMCFTIQIKKEDFEIPGSYLLKMHDEEGKYAILSILNKIKNEKLILFQEDIDQAKRMCKEIFFF